MDVSGLMYCGEGRLQTSSDCESSVVECPPLSTVKLLYKNCLNDVNNELAANSLVIVCHFEKLRWTTYSVVIVGRWFVHKHQITAAGISRCVGMVISSVCVCVSAL